MAAVANDNFFAENWKYLLAAVLLHVAIGTLYVFVMQSHRQTIIPGQLAIKAVVIDHTAARQKREREQAEADRAKRERAEAEQQARDKAEAERQQREQEAKREAERQEAIAEQKRKAEVQERIAAQRRAADEKSRLTDLKLKQAERQKAEREAREQALRENELRRQLAEEEGLRRVENSGLLNQYVALIEQQVVRNWNKPPSARPGIECTVKVTQAPGGTVLSVQIDQCNGDQAVRASIEAAVYRSSPLPAPPDSRLFQRVLVFVFKPSE